MGTFAFPHKNYGSFILPAGDYEAVRVVIGSGKGANWWCVLFPPLCFITSTSNLDAVPNASTGPSPTAVEAGYLNNPTAVEIGPNGCQGSLKYEFRFRSLELIEQLKENWSNKNKNT